MRKEECAALDRELRTLFGLAVPPITVAFVKDVPDDLPRPGGAMPVATPDGRTDAVPAGCVFWMKAAEDTFATTAADHGNCSFGSFTHGFKSFEESASGADVAASECGFTSQYADLEALGQLYRARGVVLLGVPSNDFGGQEPGSEAEIKSFCQRNYGVDFPRTAKEKVVGTEAYPFFWRVETELGEAVVPCWNSPKISDRS